MTTYAPYGRTAAELDTTLDGSYLGLEAARSERSGTRFRIELHDKDAFGAMRFEGRVTSEVVIDTDTGAWTLRRFRRRGELEVDLQTTLLVPPLP